MQYTSAILNLSYAFTPTYSVGRPDVCQSIAEKTTHNFHGLTHTTLHTLTLESAIGLIPFRNTLFHKFPALQPIIVNHIQRSSCPSVLHTHKHTDEHAAARGYAFKSSLIPTLLSTSKDDLIYPFWIQTDHLGLFLSPQTDVYSK